MSAILRPRPASRQGPRRRPRRPAPAAAALMQFVSRVKVSGIEKPNVSFSGGAEQRAATTAAS